jgi:biopolymer transport protein ExbD
MAIVFFSLLSFITLRSALGTFDLVQPPTAPATHAVSPKTGAASPELVVRVDRDRFVVRHWRGEMVIRRPAGATDASLATLRRTLEEWARTYGQGVHITVVPSDNVLYDDLIRVLDEVHRVEPRAVSLGARARR